MRPFVAIGAVLREAGLERARGGGHGPRQGAAAGRGPGRPRLRRGARLRAHPQAELWRAAVDALIRLRSLPVPASLPLPDGASYTLPRRDRAAFEIEIELLLDWYWPAIKGAPCTAVRARRVRGAVDARARPAAGAARRLVPARLPLAEPDLAARAPGDRPRRHPRFPGRAQRARRLRSGLPPAGCARDGARGPGGASFSRTTAPRSPGASPPSTPRHSPPPMPTSAPSATRGSSASGCG